MPHRTTKTTQSVVDSLSVVLVCASLSAFHWLKLGDLVGGDSIRWFLEAHRTASGEAPYRDFSWLYPPLGLWVFSGVCWIFGSTFAAIQAALDILSTALCLLSWIIARKMLPRPVALSIAILTALGGASNTGNFALFSLQLYAPGLLTGLVGFLAFLVPLIDRLKIETTIGRYAVDWRSAAWFLGGSTVACLSKVEFAVGIVGTCIVFGLLSSFLYPGRPPGWWSVRRGAALAVISMGPSIGVLLIVGGLAGRRQLAEALAGYGVAGLTCPWWPTGLGVLSIVAILARAGALAAVLSLPRARALAARWGRQYFAFLVAAGLGLVLVRLQLRYALEDFAHSQGVGTSSILLTVRYLLSLTAFLLPVMWTAVVFLVFSVWQVWQRRTLDTNAAPWILLASAGVLVSSRSLFGDLFSRVPVVAQSAYPIWFIFSGAVGMVYIRWVRRPGSQWNSWLLSVILVGYGCLRMGNQLSSDRAFAYQSLRTEAGRVRLRSYDQSAQLYQEVLRRTGPQGRLLEIPFGGGLTFASHRRSSLFLTQFTGLSPSAFIEGLDLASLRRSPPDLIIAEQGPRFGSGRGVMLGCTFPRLAFAPPAHDPAIEPIHSSLASIRRQYKVVSRVGDRVILTPNIELTPADHEDSDGDR